MDKTERALEKIADELKKIRIVLEESNGVKAMVINEADVERLTNMVNGQNARNSDLHF